MARDVVGVHDAAVAIRRGGIGQSRNGVHSVTSRVRQVKPGDVRAGTLRTVKCFAHDQRSFATSIIGRRRMDSLIYLVGLIVVIMAILSFLGLR
jgi:hypothetical protein